MSMKARGFASMHPDVVREISKKGGQAGHEKGTAHEWTSEEAKAAGRKGGLANAAYHRARKADALALKIEHPE